MRCAAAIDAAIGSLTLANPDPAKRVAAAEAVFKSRDAKALPAIEAALAKETDPTREERRCCKRARQSWSATTRRRSPIVWPRSPR